MKKLASLLVITVVLTGCATVPLFDSAGSPIIDPETGQQKTKSVVDPKKAADLATTVGASIPGPIGMAIPLVVGLATLVLGKKE